MKYCFLDFEFNGTAERFLNLVSVAYFTIADGVQSEPVALWLHNQSKHSDAVRELKKIATTHTLVAYALESEARALEALGVDLATLHGIDLYVEYRRLLNHNHRLSYGNQYIDGKVIRTSPPPPKWGNQAPDGKPHNKPSYSLAGACYKLLSVKIDTAEKEKMRNVLIHGTPAEVEQSRDDILKYNLSDIVHLPKLLKAIIGCDFRLSDSTKLDANGHVADFLPWAIERGAYSISTAKMVGLGYPVDMGKVSRFESNIERIISAATREVILSTRELVPFNWDAKDEKYTLNVKGVQQWIGNQNFPNWRVTTGGKPSYAAEAFGDWFNSQSPGFPGAFCRYLKIRQSLNGFVPSLTGKRGVFRDYVGSDNRARPFMGIFGSQSSRSQPGAVGFIPLKSHWMRNFIAPQPGRALTGIDYSSQEFLIAALLSQDGDMMAAYESGDVYTAFGIAGKVLPKGATKKTHPVERELLKAAVLGISYDMTAMGLAPRMSQVAGSPVTEAKAQGYIDLFYEVYDRYAEWKNDTLAEYRNAGYLTLPDGWAMFGDNDNHRSVGNFPVQGHGAVIMREAVKMAQDAGLDVIYTLHDALYIEALAFDFEAVATLRGVMVEAFNKVMRDYGKTITIRTEGETWSPDYDAETSSGLANITCLPEYVDDKGKADLNRYRIYFQ